MVPGRAGTMTHDDQRNGTTDLFAAMNVATGEVLTHCQKGHTAEDVLRFFKQIDATVPRGLAVHVVLDNLSAHKAPEITKWLAHKDRRRWHLHFTPTSSYTRRPPPRPVPTAPGQPARSTRPPTARFGAAHPVPSSAQRSGRDHRAELRTLHAGATVYQNAAPGQCPEGGSDGFTRRRKQPTAHRGHTAGARQLTASGRDLAGQAEPHHTSAAASPAGQPGPTGRARPVPGTRSRHRSRGPARHPRTGTRRPHRSATRHRRGGRPSSTSKPPPPPASRRGPRATRHHRRRNDHLTATTPHRRRSVARRPLDRGGGTAPGHAALADRSLNHAQLAQNVSASGPRLPNPPYPDRIRLGTAPELPPATGCLPAGPCLSSSRSVPATLGSAQVGRLPGILEHLSRVSRTSRGHVPDPLRVVMPPPLDLRWVQRTTGG